MTCTWRALIPWLLIGLLLTTFLIVPVRAQGEDSPPATPAETMDEPAADADADVDDPAYSKTTDPREQLPLNLDDNVLGSGQEPDRATPELGGASIARYLLSVALWLAICVGLIYGLVALLRLWYRRFPGGTSHAMVETLGSFTVAAGVAIHVVRFHDVILLMAATGNSVSLIEKVTDPDRVALLVQALSPRPTRPNPASFGAVLQKAQRVAKLPARPPVSTGLDLDAMLAASNQPEPRVWVVSDDDPGAQLEREEKLEALRQAIRDLQGLQAEEAE